MADQLIHVPVIAITIVVIAFVVVLIWRRAGSPRVLSKKSAPWFLAVGLLYMLIAVVVTALVSGTESLMNDLMNMDLTLFNLGLLFFIIGVAAMIVASFKVRAQ